MTQNRVRSATPYMTRGESAASEDYSRAKMAGAQRNCSVESGHFPTVMEGGPGVLCCSSHRISFGTVQCSCTYSTPFCSLLMKIHFLNVSAIDCKIIVVRV